MQPRGKSFVEASINVAIGACVSWLVWVFVVVPLYGYSASSYDSAGIVAIFTVASIIRSYVIRRIGNRWLR